MRELIGQTCKMQVLDTLEALAAPRYVVRNFRSHNKCGFYFCFCVPIEGSVMLDQVDNWLSWSKVRRLLGLNWGSGPIKVASQAPDPLPIYGRQPAKTDGGILLVPPSTDFL